MLLQMRASAPEVRLSCPNPEFFGKLFGRSGTFFETHGHDINYASIKLFMPMSPRHWTRGEKIPWAAGPEDRIQPTPHAVDEFVRYIGGAHVIDVIRWRPRNFTNSFH